MATRRRRQTATAEPALTDTDSQGRLNPSVKPKKSTVAQNAQAIETLSQQMTGLDSQLSTMNQMLAQIAAASSMNSENQRNESVNNVLTSPAQNHSSETGFTMQPPDHSPNLDGPPEASHPTDYIGAPHHRPGPTPPGRPDPSLDGPGYLGILGQRSRHNTTGQLAPPQPTAWRPHTGFSTGLPTTAPAAPSAAQQQRNYLSAHRQLTNPWDHPVTLQDMETDADLTRCVTEALQAATPFSTVKVSTLSFRTT